MVRGAGFASNLKEAVKESLASSHVPGAVLLVARDGKVIFHEAAGFACIEPAKARMRRDAIFDLASLTKPCATALATMLLVDRGVLTLSDPVAKWFPAFASGGKSAVSLHDLATHTSGIDDSGLYDLANPMETTADIMELLSAKKPFAPPGTVYVYADLNYISLGKVVEAAAGVSLDRFFSENIASPLGMRDSGFNPAPIKRRRCAATEFIDGRILVGEVHDPRARQLSGVAGHAGLFGTAREIFSLAQMLLDGGVHKRRRLLSRTSVRALTEVSSPCGLHPRTIGWDTDPAGTGPRGNSFPFGGFGHTGFTGTSVWVDPPSRTIVVLLTNRVHPLGKGQADSFRRRVADVVAAAVTTRGSKTKGRVRTGIDILAREKFRSLRGKRIGLVTNLAAVDGLGRPTLDLFAAARRVELAAIFTPEHGLEARLEEEIPSGTHEKLALPVHSLYGGTRRPAGNQLSGLDVLVVDLPDIGVRFYTYHATLAYCMEECVRAGVKVMVLDRPNPLTGGRVEGPLLAPDKFGFTGYAALPVCHGMTMGELARFMNVERGIGADLEVVKVQGWRRKMWFDETGLPWANPSPNIRTLTQAILYPAIGLLEFTNISVGRGTGTPFQHFGAPWLDGAAVARALDTMNLPGVGFYATTFNPTAGPFAGKRCSGCALILLNRDAFRPVLTGVAIAGVIRRLHGDTYKLEGLDSLIGNAEIRAAIVAGTPPPAVAATWKRGEKEFRRRRLKYLL